MTADPRLEQLWALHEIRQLAYRYAYAVDTRDWELMESLWVETPSPLDRPALDIHFARGLPERFKTQSASTLFVGNHLIEFDGPDRAHGSVYCLAFVDRPEQFFEQAIIYNDQYERHGGKWLFLKRDHLLWWGREPAVNPMRQPPANWPASQVGAGIAFDQIRKG